MTIPRNILVPVDFSTQSEHALDYAVALAAKLDATVHIFHTVEFPAFGVPELGVAMTEAMIDDVVKDSQAALDNLINPRRSLARIGRVVLRTGDARDLILHGCEDVQADLIVMGTHGRRGLRRALLGSVAEAIVRTAPCPVLTVRLSTRN
jgi:nucleotide-binding universal stress UspA family protein